MSKVIILGAGSSKDCGLPLGGEIWKYFDNYDNEPWYSYLSKIFPQFSDNFSRYSRNGGKYPTFELTCSLIDYAIKSKEGLDKLSEDLKIVKKSLICSYREVFRPSYVDLLPMRLVRC